MTQTKNAAGGEIATQPLFKRLAVHMDGLAARVHRIECLLSPQMLDASARENRTIRDLQHLDYLRQSLEDCALLLLLLGQHLSQSFLTVEDIAAIQEKLRLESTQELFTDPVVRPVSTLHENTGEIDLF
ncbi:MAG: hypothetical protein AAF755_13825 [Pseudomonadota bacterium]